MDLALRRGRNAALGLVAIAAAVWVAITVVRSPVRREVSAPSPLFQDAVTVRDLQSKVASHPREREWLDRLAVAYVQEGQFLSAIEILTRIIQQPGPQPDARRGLVHCYNQIEGFDSALPHLLNLVQLEPRSLDLRLELADQYRQLGDPGRGEKVLDDIPRDASGYPTFSTSDGRAAAMERVAVVYGDLGSWEKGCSLARRLVMDTPDRLSAHVVLGKALFCLGRIQEALPHLKQGLDAAPDDPDLQFLLASALKATSRAEDQAELKKLLLRVLSKDKTRGWAWYEIGLIYRREKNWSRAAQCFQSAYDQKWERTPCLKYLGEAFGQLGRVEESLYRRGLYYEAIAQPEKALPGYLKLSQMHPEDIHGSLHIARAYDLMGAHRKQEAVLLRAWARDRSEPLLLVDLARCYENLKEFDNEKKTWELYIQEDASHADRGYEGLGVLADNKGQLDEAERNYRRCVELVPTSDEYKLRLARLLLHRRNDAGKLAEAVRLLEDALRLSRESSELLFQLGLAYLYTDRKEDAILALRHAIDLEPDIPRPYFQLSQLLRQTGRLQQSEWALSMYRRYRDYQEREHSLLERLHRVPKDASAREQLATLYETANKPDEAVHEYETVLETQPDNVKARSRLSVLYADLGRYDRQAQLTAAAARPKGTGGD